MCRSFHSGCAANTKGTAFVVYEDIFDAKNACEHLSGFNVCNRYLVVLYYQPHKVRTESNIYFYAPRFSLLFGGHVMSTNPTPSVFYALCRNETSILSDASPSASVLVTKHVHT